MRKILAEETPVFASSGNRGDKNAGRHRYSFSALRELINVKIKKEYVKILDLENEFEAGLLSKELEELDIPHEIHSLHDQAFDGLYQMLHGWGFITAPPERAEEIKSVYQDLLKDIDRKEKGLEQKESEDQEEFQED